MICSVKPSSAEPDGPILEIRCSRNPRNLGQSSESTMVDPDDWRAPLVRYLENLGHVVDRKVRQQTLKICFA
jgi:hypothetical protein